MLNIFIPEYCVHYWQQLTREALNPTNYIRISLVNEVT